MLTIPGDFYSVLESLCNFSYFEFLTSMWHCYINMKTNKEKHNYFHFDEKSKGKREKGRKPGHEVSRELGPLPTRAA